MEKWIFGSRLLRAMKMSSAATHSASSTLGSLAARLKWDSDITELNAKLLKNDKDMNVVFINPMISPKGFTGLLDSLTQDARTLNCEINLNCEGRTNYCNKTGWHPILIHLFSSNPVRKPVNNDTVNGFGKTKFYYAVWWFYRLMISEGQIPSFQTLNDTVECFSRMHEVQHSFAVLGTMLKMGFAPNFVTYVNLMVGLVVEEKWVEVTSLLKGMEKTGLPPYSYFHYYFCGRIKICGDDKIMKKVQETFDEYARKQGWNLE